VEVFWIMTPCNIMAGYLHLRGPCCLHPTTALHGVTTQKTSIWSITTMKTLKLAKVR